VDREGHDGSGSQESSHKAAPGHDSSPQVVEKDEEVTKLLTDGEFRRQGSGCGLVAERAFESRRASTGMNFGARKIGERCGNESNGGRTGSGSFDRARAVGGERSGGGDLLAGEWRPFKATIS
jgi:hypothetical protein